MTFCIHNFATGDPAPARSRQVDWRRFVRCSSFLLRLVESHLATMQRLHGLLATPRTSPDHPARHLWTLEESTSDLVLRYGMEVDESGQSCLQAEAMPDDTQILHIVASSPILKPCTSAPGLPPPPPRFTPLAMSILRKRLPTETSNADPGIPYTLTAVHEYHALRHILPSLSNRETGVSAQSHTPKHQSHPDRHRRVTTKP